MPRTAKALLCRLLVVLLAWMPYQAARAELIATAEVVAQGDRETVERFLSRAEVAQQLQKLGIEPKAAAARAAALSDDEAALLAREIGTLPVGGNTAAPFALVAVILIIIVLIGMVVGAFAPGPAKS